MDFLHCVSGLVRPDIRRSIQVFRSTGHNLASRVTRRHFQWFGIKSKRQYRQGIREVTTEFPAGGIERKDGIEYGDRKAAEDALLAAKRELKEETGYESDDWSHLLTVPASATISDNYAHIFLAVNCRKTGSQSLDETEYLRVVRHTAPEIEELIYTGRFQQSVHVMAWLLAKEKHMRNDH